jgi:uncharacterized membrane protein YfhO
VTAPTFRPHVEAIVAEPLARPLTSVPLSDAEGARVTLYRPEQVSIETRTVAPALLVLTDTFFPGWHATVDGTPARIHRADLAFRGVEVPAGHHSVSFTYRPRPFLIGAAISMTTLVTLVTAALLVPIRKRLRATSAGDVV